MPLKIELQKEKLLDPKAYNTVFISLEDEYKAKKEQLGTLVELLCDDRHKADRNEILALLKREPKAKELLISAIAESKGEDKRKLLIAFWEADLECAPYIDFFTDIVIKDEFPVALEALTSIENTQEIIGPEKAEELLNRVITTYPLYVDTPKGHLLSDLSEVIGRWR
jgi:hypothetical protein